MGAGVGLWFKQKPQSPAAGNDTETQEDLNPAGFPSDLSEFTRQREDIPDEIIRPTSEDSPAASEVAAQQAATSQPAPASAADLTVTPTARMLADADEWLRMGYYSRARDRFQTVLDHSQGPALESIRLRIALCHEFLGDTSIALESYRQLAVDARLLNIRDLARLGEARCLIARQETELLTTEIFPTAILDESSWSRRVNGELLHLIGRAMMLDSQHVGRVWSAVTADDINQLVIPNLNPDPDRELQLLRGRAVTTTTERIPVFRVLQKTQGSPDGCFVQINQPRVGVRSLLTSMVTHVGFTSELSVGVEAAIAGHGQTVVVDDKSLSLILDAVALRFGLMWNVEGDVLRFLTADEAEPEALAEFQTQVTERMLRWAGLTAPESYQAHSSQLMLGVLQYDRGLFVEASHVFQLYIERHPHTLLTGIAALNLAKCFLQNHQYDEAEQALLRSIDHSHSTLDTQVAAYMYLGRLRMERGHIPEALSSLKVATARSRGHRSEPDIAILLASAYLLADNPSGTNSVLMQRRSLFVTPQQKARAAFLSAYSRLRRASDPVRVARETEGVVAALASLEAGNNFGKHWYLLVAAAYEDCGLRPDAVRTYEAALQTRLPDFLLTHCGIQLSNLLVADGLTQSAEQILGALPETDNNKVHCRGLVSRAQLAWKLGKYDEAITYATEAALESEEVETTQAALQVLGDSYEKSGNRLAAVYCFAGMVPHPESNVRPVSHTAVAPAEPATRNAVPDTAPTGRPNARPAGPAASAVVSPGQTAARQAAERPMDGRQP